MCIYSDQHRHHYSCVPPTNPMPLQLLLILCPSYPSHSYHDPPNPPTLIPLLPLPLLPCPSYPSHSSHVLPTPPTPPHAPPILPFLPHHSHTPPTLPCPTPFAIKQLLTLQCLKENDSLWLNVGLSLFVHIADWSGVFGSAKVLQTERTQRQKTQVIYCSA